MSKVDPHIKRVEHSIMVYIYAVHDMVGVLYAILLYVL